VLNGKLILEGKIVKNYNAVSEDETLSFHGMLESCFLDLCKNLEIPIPIWMKKNTRELGMFRRTFFTPEQFIEKVWFDRFEIRLGE